MTVAHPGVLWRLASTRMPTKWGMFTAIGFERDVSNGSRPAETAVALVMGDVTAGTPLLRIHSQCFTGELLGSLRCDCHDQLEMAMQAIAQEGRGLLIYEYQEGRGIGLMAKLEAYELWMPGSTPSRPTMRSGSRPIVDFSPPAVILRDFRIKRVRLLEQSAQSQRLDRAWHRGWRPAQLRGRAKPALACLPADQKGKNGSRTDPSARRKHGSPP